MEDRELTVKVRGCSSPQRSVDQPESPQAIRAGRLSELPSKVDGESSLGGRVRRRQGVEVDVEKKQGSEWTGSRVRQEVKSTGVEGATTVENRRSC